MKYFVILLILAGFLGSVFAQNLGDGPDDIWMPACLKESNTECDRSSLFHDAISRPFAQSDSVAVGTIIQKEKQEQNSIKYSINVNFYLKNYQPFDLLTATLNNATEPQTWPEVLYYNSPVFNEGDLVFVYLKKIDGQYNILPESFALDKQEVRGPPPTILLTKSPSEDNFEQGDEILVSGEVRKMELVKAAKDGEQLDVKLALRDENNQVIFSDLIDIDVDGSYNYSFQTSIIPPGKYELEVNYGPSTTGDQITIEFNPRYWTPLKQFESGIPIDEIQCRDGLILIQKRNGFPACVKPETKQILVERGWAKTVTTPKQISTFDYEIKTGGVTHGSQYQIVGGMVDQITYDESSNSLTISLDAQENGHVQIVLPSGLLSSPTEEAFTKYSVIQDGKEVDFEQLTPILLKIPFEKDTKQILIERESSQEKSTQEHYEIDIIGLKDKYIVGEPYSFYFVISGYGYGCASYEVTYPDENGNIMKTTVDVLCAAEQSMDEFEINFFELKGTLGNVGIKKSGTYTVTVTFEKPNKFFPTTASKEFRVVEN